MVIKANENVSIKEGILNYVKLMKDAGYNPPFTLRIRQDGYDVIKKNIRSNFLSDEEMEEWFKQNEIEL